MDVGYLQYSKVKDNNSSISESLFFDYYKVDEDNEREILNKKYFQIFSNIENSYINQKYYYTDYFTEMDDKFFIEIYGYESLIDILANWNVP